MRSLLLLGCHGACGSRRSGAQRRTAIRTGHQLVVPVPPGGAADFVARTIGRKLSDALGQPVVISNRGGAGGTIAAATTSPSRRPTATRCC